MRNAKFLLLIPLVALVGALATATQAPYNKDTHARFNAVEARVTVVEGVGIGGSLSSGKIGIGSTLNVNTERTLSGDVTNDAAGVTAIGAGKVTEAMLKVYTADGLHAARLARAEFDFADGDLDVGAHSLGQALPAKAVIIRSYIFVETQLADTGTCTLAIHCEDANNIKTATDITGTASLGFVEGESTGAASAFKGGIASACNITATVADGGSCVPSAGKGTVYVHYVTHD